MNAVCEKLFNQPLHPIRSKAARQKFLRKKVKKANRDQIRAEAIDFMLFVLDNGQEISFTQSFCDTIINNIAERVLGREPEPDVDDFEDLYPSSNNNGPPPSNNSAGSSPPFSSQIIQLPPSPDKLHYD